MSRKPRSELRSAWNDPVRATLVQRRILGEKFLLGRWYEGIYRFISENLKDGPVTVELGSGTSFLDRHIDVLIKTNIIVVPGNDVAFDACSMSFKDNSVNNIVLISVFHHLADPEAFLSEAARVLKPGGRILISDPYISALSYPMWRFVHPEGCDLSRAGFKKSIRNNPVLNANSANATLMFARKDAREKYSFPELKVVEVAYHTVLHYWLAGGYNLPPLMPKWSLGMINLAEKLFHPFGRLLASFMFVVLEKK